jgi:hypothetical protein
LFKWGAIDPYDAAMYIETVPNRGSPPAILLRESYREAGKVRKRTLLNLSDCPHERIAGFKALLNGGTVIPEDQDAITIIRSLPHGHVDAALRHGAQDRPRSAARPRRQPLPRPHPGPGGQPHPRSRFFTS